MKRIYLSLACLLCFTLAFAEEVTFNFVENSYGADRSNGTAAPSVRIRQLSMTEGKVTIQYNCLVSGTTSRIGFNKRGLFLGTATDFNNQFEISAADAKIVGLEISKYRSGSCGVKIDDVELFQTDDVFVWSGDSEKVTMVTSSAAIKSDGSGPGVLTSIKVIYSISNESAETLGLPETLDIIPSSGDAKISVKYSSAEESAHGIPEFSINIGASSPAVKLTVGIPKGWDSMCYLQADSTGTNDIEDTPILFREAKWEDFSVLTGKGYVNSNEFEIPAGYEKQVYDVYLGKNGKVDLSSVMRLNFIVENETSVEISDAVTASDEAEYYNLQGLKISTPGSGIYIRKTQSSSHTIVIK